MKTTIQENTQPVVPADAEAYAEAATYPERMWEQLVARNDGLTNNIQRAHCALQRLIDLAAATASKRAIPLPEVEITCPQLMSLQGWNDYAVKPQDFNFNVHQLRTWFIVKHGTSHQFHIHATGGSVTITFSPTNAPEYDFWCRID